jgi:hypothetical protein
MSRGGGVTEQFYIRRWIGGDDTLPKGEEKTSSLISVPGSQIARAFSGVVIE